MARTPRDIVEYRIYELPVDLPLICLTGDEWRISDVPRKRLHFHNCLEIGFCHSHSGFLQFENETVPFSAGDIFLIPRHVPHTTCSAKGCRSQWSYLFTDLSLITQGTPGAAPLQPAAEADNLHGYIKLSPGTSSRLHFLATCLLEEARKPRRETEHLQRIYALALTAELMRYQQNESRPVSNTSRTFPLKPALEYIHEHYMEPCDTETLASLCHLSQTHFRRLFLACMDATPLQFVISTRIHQACVLLANTNEPVLTIAQAVGMPSASSFNRNFQQVVGMSPRQYRASCEARTGIPRHKGQVQSLKGWTLPDK